ncbi:MAG: tetratricopeptide repeat protein [Pseudomonadota bacterium]
MNRPFSIGPFVVDPRSGELIEGERRERLEPKVMQLLVELAEQAPDVVDKTALTEALWPDTVVTEDALARSLLKLRRALGDDAKSPRFIETLPRRGYRLLIPVEWQNLASETVGPSGPPSPSTSAPWWGIGIAVALIVAVVFVGWRGSETATGEPPLLARAHDHYYQFTEADNERAYLLYERILQSLPDLAEAQAGQANTLVQRLIRWPDTGPPIPPSEHRVAAALASDRLTTPWAQATLERAQLLVDQAVAGDADSGFAWKAHGLVAMLSGDADRAAQSYLTALEVDPGNWEAAFNLGELNHIAGDERQAIDYYQTAYRIMEGEYSQSAQRIGPWQPELGVAIGAMYQNLGESSEAEAWYRTVLESTPLHVEATLALASARARAGDVAEAEALCRDLISRIGPLEDCQPYVPDTP